MRFIETPVFTDSVRRHLDEETYRALQVALLLRPTQGPVIQEELDCASCGGLFREEGNEGVFA